MENISSVSSEQRNMLDLNIGIKVTAFVCLCIWLYVFLCVTISQGNFLERKKLKVSTPLGINRKW
jgi:hypothetical protein